VARDLGLSVATVSRALAKQIYCAPQRPLACARPWSAWLPPQSRSANLKRGSTGIIYVVVPSLSPFFLEIFRGAERAALERGYSIVMGHTDRRPDRENEYIDKVSCGQGDGILLVSTAEAVTIVNDKHKLPPNCRRSGSREKPRFSGSSYRSMKGAMEATNHLLALGHRRIAHISGPARSPAAISSTRWLSGGARGGGHPLRRRKLCAGEFTIASGEAAMASLLARPKRPTAIFCANDEIAIGAIRASRRRV